MNLRTIDEYLRATYTTEQAYREALSEGFVIYHRQAPQLLVDLERGNNNAVAAVLRLSLIGAYGKQAEEWDMRRQKEMLAAAGGAIHQRAQRWASGQ